MSKEGGERRQIFTSAVFENIQKDLQCALQNLSNERLKTEKLQKKLDVSENMVSAQRKEILMLQHQLASDCSIPQSGKLKGVKDMKPRSSIDEPDIDSVEVKKLLKRVEYLEKQNEDMTSCIRKQNKLIDILKRQKILLESASLLSIHEKEFEKFLELEKY
ncbi:unnamed protein product [Phytomonas sp. EM1]|nr:unnamed protein product [Phytomonas sp. EM1]|eukprot:CCW62227.1 unnamed protein product [Phytomonas sp. isolate EM1]